MRAMKMEKQLGGRTTMTAVTNCISRFDEDTKQSFLDLYTKVDAGDEMENEENS